MKRAPPVLADLHKFTIRCVKKCFLNPDVMSNVTLSQLHIIPSSTITGGKL